MKPTNFTAAFFRLSPSNRATEIIAVSNARDVGGIITASAARCISLRIADICADVRTEWNYYRCDAGKWTLRLDSRFRGSRAATCVSVTTLPFLLLSRMGPCSYGPRNTRRATALANASTVSDFQSRDHRPKRRDRAKIERSICVRLRLLNSITAAAVYLSPQWLAAQVTSEVL